MFRKAKPNAKVSKPNHFGLDLPGLYDTGPDEAADEGDLEAELLAILKEDGQKTPVEIGSLEPFNKVVSHANEIKLSEIVDKEDETVDEDDPELLAELKACLDADSSPTVSKTSPQPAPRASPKPATSSNLVASQQITERLSAYEGALGVLKTANNPADSSKVRRYERAVNELKSLQAQAARGKFVNLDDLPPAPPASLAVNKTTNDPIALPQPPAIVSQTVEPVAPTLATTIQPVPISKPTVDTRKPDRPSGRQMMLNYINSSNPTAADIAALKHRHQEYKLAAIHARDAGQIGRAKDLLIASKLFDELIPKIEAGTEPFDAATDMPPPPSEFVGPSGLVDTPQADEPPAKLPAVSAGLCTSSVVSVENLKGRMEIFKHKLEAARADPNEGSKQRRLGRVIAQYEEALRACERGLSNYNYSDLPAPPGCPPLSSKMNPNAQSASGPALAASAVANDAVKTTKSQRILESLQKRQAELKRAAYEAKQAGQIEVAKTHLRAALGMNQMLQAAELGLPVDLSELPPSPAGKHTAGTNQSSTTEQMLTGKSCEPPLEFQHIFESAANEEARGRLLLQLLDQQNQETEQLAREHRRVGSTSSADKLSELTELGRRSETVLRARLHRSEPTLHHFEFINLPRLNMNPDLAEDALEITVLRGYTFPNPDGGSSSADQLSTYVELLLAFPKADEPLRHVTDYVKHSANPIYEGSAQSLIRFTVNRKARSFVRYLEGHRGLKANVYYSRGLLKRAALLGTVTFRLNGLLQSATIQQTGDLMDGRKAIGGRLEIRARHRASLEGKIIEFDRKPWLMIAPRKQPPVQLEQSRKTSLNPRSSPGITIVPRASDKPNHNSLCSLAVLRYERDRLTAAAVDSSQTRHDLENLNFKLRQLESRLIVVSELPKYANELNSLLRDYDYKVQLANNQGDTSTAQRYMRRRQLVKEELAQIQRRSSTNSNNRERTVDSFELHSSGSHATGSSSIRSSSHGRVVVQPVSSPPTGVSSSHSFVSSRPRNSERVTLVSPSAEHLFVYKSPSSRHQ